MSTVPDGYRHGLRVRVGPARKAGVLLECTGRDGSTFWRIRLQGVPSEWLSPHVVPWVIDGAGPYVVAACRDCDLPFLAADPTAPQCDRCHAEAFGTTTERLQEQPIGERADRVARRWRRGR